MTTLQHEYRKNTYTYVLVLRNEHAAIYAQMDKNRLVAYEVGKIKIRPDGDFRGKQIEGGECFWSNEDIGRTAWSIPQKDRAMAVYWEMTRKAIKAAEEKANAA